MKRIATVLLAVMLTAATVPAMAEMTKEEKDQCLLASKGCTHEVDTLQKQVKRIQAEIKKGTKVYTAEELKTLEQKLKEVNDFIKTMGKPGK
jgi:peptidoglycan hydrolase CwlO-like protein